LEKYAVATPPGAASSGPSQNIFISFAAKPHPIINIQISYEIFYTSINTELFFHYFKIIYPNELKVVCHITFRLYATLQAAHKANRRFAAACNVAEKNRTKALWRRLRFFGARGAFRPRSVYRPVMRRTAVHNLSFH
jgi:hypothetical protein